LRSFICPGTHHSVSNNPQPITRNGWHPPDETGLSYEQRLHDNITYIPDLQRMAEDSPANNYNAASKTGPGHSYEVSGFINANAGTAIRKTQTSVAAYVYHNNLSYKVKGKTLSFSLQGQTGSPCNIWLMYDGDNWLKCPDGSEANNDYPDPIDNHGADGGNIIFCDGHAEWVRAGGYPEKFAFGTEIINWGAN
jgi:prepilin-type processing-associated H-X9-DG protein